MKENPMIILIGWVEDELTYIKSFKYPSEEEEAQRMFKVLSESGASCQKMTKGFFFKNYLKDKLEEEERERENFHK